MTTRRRFIQHTLTGSLALAAFNRNSVFAADGAHASHDGETNTRAEANAIRTNTAAPLIEPQQGETLITILHTNDTHSQIDPLPANDANAGKGGVARRATLVSRVRKTNPNTLLIDAGDAWQGTPYFNLYKGEVEFRAMSAIGYDAMTLGNHEFDNGVEPLADAIKKFVKFPIVSSNYDVRGTALEPLVKPYITREVGGIRVGIFGLGVQLEGLNAPASFKGVKILDPIVTAREMVKKLREQERCQMVVCASHLGYFPNSKTEIGDTQVASRVDGIDFIASGHTHTFMDSLVLTRQPSGKTTVIFQVGKSGIYLGRVDFIFRNGTLAAHAGNIIDLRSAELA